MNETPKKYYWLPTQNIWMLLVLVLYWQQRGEGSLKPEICFMFLRQTTGTFMELRKTQIYCKSVGVKVKGE